MLPGGTVETTDATPEDTLHREAAEEAQLTLTDPVRLGRVLDKPGEVHGGMGAQRPAPPGRPGHRHRAAGRRPRHRAPLHPSARHPRPDRRPAGLGPTRSPAGPTCCGHGTQAVGPARRSRRRHRGDSDGGGCG
ncbi:NUDIX domain-containing protein [Streptomyces tendae]